MTRVLIDTNVLLRIRQLDHPHSAVAEVALAQLRSLGHDLCVVPQVIYEYWVASTRPIESNGLGVDLQDARSQIAEIQTMFLFLPDSPEVFQHWEQLVSTVEIRGKLAHDARIVAAMHTHRIATLLSFNLADFARFDGITARSPFEVAGNT